MVPAIDPSPCNFVLIWIANACSTSVIHEKHDETTLETFHNVN